MERRLSRTPFAQNESSFEMNTNTTFSSSSMNSSFDDEARAVCRE